MTTRLDRDWEPITRADAEAFLTEDLPQLPAETFREEDSLNSSRALLALLDDPQDAYPTVHVAGTAGKGTVATAIATALGPCGRIGLHVSPHVYDLGERFQIDGLLPKDPEVVALVQRVLPALRRHRRTRFGVPTYFETTCAMAFTRFADASCDLAVIEVGLGGLYDTTNAIDRSDKLAVITRLGLDHQHVLGSTLPEIAFQKAGILPADGDAVVLRPEDPAAWAVVQRVADERRCRLHVVDPPEPSEGPTPHLAEDDLLVRAALGVLGRRDPRWRAAVAPSLRDLHLPGRFERLPLEAGEVVLDGAHNPLKLEALLERVEAAWPDERLPWVFGCKGDKEARGMLELIAPRSSSLCVVGFAVPAGDAPASASRPAAELAGIARELAPDLDVEVAGDVAQAAAWAKAALSRDRPVAVTGSFHLLRPLRARLLGGSDRAASGYRTRLADQVPLAVVGGKLLTDLVDVTSDLTALDSTGTWAVVIPFEGPAVCARFSTVQPARQYPWDPWRDWAAVPTDEWRTSLDRDQFCTAVEDIRSSIGRGDVYQVNLTRILSTPLHANASIAALGAALGGTHAAPFSAVVRIPAYGIHVASASPERYLERDGHRIWSSPIKGTAAMGADFLPKDRAENIMIVDLVRNDLGRVCEWGSVHVPDGQLLAVEEHPGLKHLVTTIEGRLRPGLGWAEAVDATFPPGSVTGAPKEAALQHISRLETSPREVYCGAVGWVDADRRRGALNVAIRTFWFSEGELRFGTGGGITWDSDPAGEWRETEIKAGRLTRAAARGLSPRPPASDDTGRS